MKIFTKRNALVGYLALRAASHMRVTPRRRTKRRATKLGLLLILGLASVGLVFGLAIVLRRQKEAQHLEGYAVADKVGMAPADESAPSLEPSQAA